MKRCKCRSVRSRKEGKKIKFGGKRNKSVLGFGQYPATRGAFRYARRAVKGPNLFVFEKFVRKMLKMQCLKWEKKVSTDGLTFDGHRAVPVKTTKI